MAATCVLHAVKPFPAVSFNQVLSSDCHQRLISPSAVEEEDEKIQAFVDGWAAQWQTQLIRKRSGQQLYSNKNKHTRLTPTSTSTQTIKDVSSYNYMPAPELAMDVPPPPPGYVCHRCHVPGHLIHLCPTHGDPTFDRAAALKRSRPPARLPDEQAFLTELANVIPTTSTTPTLSAQDHSSISAPRDRHAVVDETSLPPELRCPLCQHVMKEAVIASKCCFRSFCDTCIRGHLFSYHLTCFCGAPNVLADYLLPNITLRDAMDTLIQLAKKKATMTSSSSRSSSTMSSAVTQLHDDSFEAATSKEENTDHSTGRDMQNTNDGGNGSC
ncbi:hypothetical protein GOP47_0018008 [Adiantum capillus-veneris]|uniref:Zinc knuckle CX2CX3GHX4C domain-containing protein n=1 Tax=Adiantum capillus-veneris TaxID=13818 RepID=A0A9D4ZBE9_ADICA|nr:hypothetical protein GOP47_0018008 [Adiantum capillus-veneris]